jgi:hypothetical protein
MEEREEMVAAAELEGLEKKVSAWREGVLDTSNDDCCFYILQFSPPMYQDQLRPVFRMRL